MKVFLQSSTHEIEFTNSHVRSNFCITANILYGCKKKTGLREMVRRDGMRFYTIKLPKFLGGLVRAMLGAFKKD